MEKEKIDLDAILEKTKNIKVSNNAVAFARLLVNVANAIIEDDSLKTSLKEEREMKVLKKGQVIRFSTMDDFTGEKMILIGKVVGDHEAVKHAYPEECAEVEAGFYLVAVGRFSSCFVVSSDEILEIIKKEATMKDIKERPDIEIGDTIISRVLGEHNERWNNEYGIVIEFVGANNEEVVVDDENGYPFSLKRCEIDAVIKYEGETFWF